MDENGFLTTHQAARRLGLSPKTLQRWRLTGEGPVFRKLGRAVRYALEDLDRFADAGERRSTKGIGRWDC